MTTWYAHRRKDGSIASLHQEVQPGYAEEPLDDSLPEVQAILRPPAPVQAKRLAVDDLAAALVAKGVLTVQDVEGVKK